MYLRNVIAAFVSGIVCLGASISAASAQGYNWTGFSVYGGVGGLWLDGDVNVNDTTEFSEGIRCKRAHKRDIHTRDWDHYDWIKYYIPCIQHKNIEAVNSNSIASALNGDPGIFGTVGVAADIEATPGVVVGAFADIDWSNADADFSGSSSSTIEEYDRHHKKFTLSSATSVNGSMEHDYSYTIGGRVGVLSLNRQALFYVLGGYTRLEMDNATAQVSNSINLNIKSYHHDYEKNKGFAGDPISVNLPDSFDGYTLGVGTQVKLSQAWSIKLEGRWSNFESKTVRYSNTSVDRKKLGYSAVGFGKGSYKPICHPCKKVLRKSASSSGTIDVDPELWSGRVLVVFSF